MLFFMLFSVLQLMLLKSTSEPNTSHSMQTLLSNSLQKTNAF